MTCDGPARLTLPSQKRLRRKADFDAAYARGKRLGNAFFGVTVRRNDSDAANGARLGLAVAVRTAGSSVERNRIRRVIREFFRIHQRELPPVDIVVSARSPARDAPSPALRAALAELWKKISAAP